MIYDPSIDNPQNIEESSHHINNDADLHTHDNTNNTNFSNLNENSNSDTTNTNLGQKYDKDQMTTFLLKEILTKDLNELAESFFVQYLQVCPPNFVDDSKNNHNGTVIYWDDVPSLNSFFSRTLNEIYVDLFYSKEGVPESEKTILSTFKESNHDVQLLEDVEPVSEMDKKLFSDINKKFHNSQEITNKNILLIKINGGSDKHQGILQVIFDLDKRINSEIVELSKWFAQRLELIIQVSNRKAIPSLLTDILPIMRTEQFFNLSCMKIARSFNARECEIWKVENENQLKEQRTKSKSSSKLDEKDKEKNSEAKYLARYTDHKSIFDINKGGIVGFTINSGRNDLNCQSNIHHPAYDPIFDGEVEEPVLVHVIRSEGELFAIALRGNRRYPIFFEVDITHLYKLSKVLVLSFANSETFTEVDNEVQKNRLEKEGLTALLDVAEEISGQLDTNKLTEIIIEKGRLLTNADRCSLFLVNDSHDRLITTLQSGLSTRIDIPIDKGIVGKTVIENRTLNIPDAYKCEYFDPSTDKTTGYRTSQILSVPIRNNTGEVIGVTEMVNRLDDKPFTSWDVNLIQIFNIFCGISLENAKLFQKSVYMASQLRSFMNMSFSLSKSESVHRILSDIMQNARRSINAEYGSLYLLEDASNSLSTFIVDGGFVPSAMSLCKGIAGHCAQTQNELIINDCLNDERFAGFIKNNGNKNDDENASPNSSSSQQSSNTPTINKLSVIAAPLLRSDGTLLGVAEMVNKKNGSFTDDDMKLMKSFSTFAAIALENSRLKDIEKYGNVETEMMKYVSESERSLTNTIPEKLRFQSEELKAKILTINVFSCDLLGIDHIRTVFYIFNRFKICDEFDINNEMLFKFVFELWKTYNDVPYHNWTHACDVLQYTAYELHIGELENVFTRLEIFALLVSAICHDANHNGYNNIYNVKSETPLGILFKGQSVMETHHVTITINILDKDELNLFHSLSKENVRKMWNIVIKLILSTDMSLHFNLVKNTSNLLDNNEFSFENEDHRQIGLDLLLKVADISNVSRPFEIADKWCTILQEEFFRQGDMEKENGIGLSSPMNDRENNDKPKSQIGFYNFICLPLYQVTARVFPKLQVNVEHVKENLEVWMKMVKQEEEQKQKEEEKPKEEENSQNEQEQK
ncbi:hypothetical protein M9Y10_028377 [Tritrichomonas musculus]|uniref:PDEase domain-containing protein n=1 Tax=Tritrichomonas musculus TaxID=1915356 RepID=A0ABR2KK85_9EUKA